MAKRRPVSSTQNVSEKANKILNIILIVLVLIGLRIWHLAIIQHETKLEESKKPQRKILIEKSNRATIEDRFGIPLALNKIQYNAALVYGHLKQVPRYAWIKNEAGKKVKIPKRREYIHQLSELIAKELSLDADKIEDIIHSKASILGNVPFTIKEGLTEKEYFRLKGLEKDWPGIHTQRVAKRYYPLGFVGADVIGYLGAISKNEFETITTEMRSLRETIHQWEEGEGADQQTRQAVDRAEKRLQELEARAYTINDLIGKTGIEAACEEQLRGFQGKKIFISDMQGNFLKELPASQKARDGDKIRLSLSAELQEYAERLLAEYEAIPIARIGQFNRLGIIPPKQPWIKGGAIVVMDPNNGQVLAMASYPRFDPNDFIKDPNKEEEKKWNIHKWLENETYLGALWDEKIPLERERFSLKNEGFFQEKIFISWPNYLDFIFPNESSIKKSLLQINTIAEAINLQKKVQELLSLFYQDSLDLSAGKIFDFLYPEDVCIGSICSIKEKQHLKNGFQLHQEKILSLKKELDVFFTGLPQNYEKLLLVDLCRLLVDPSLFSFRVIDLMGHQSLSDYKEICANMSLLEDGLKKIVETTFHETDFKEWKDKEFKNYLMLKREEEEKQKKYPRPYVDYLDHKEKELFLDFWEKNKKNFLVFFLTEEKMNEIKQINPYYKQILLFAEEMKQGAHQKLIFWQSYQKLKKLLVDYAPNLIFEYISTLRFYKDLNRPLLGFYSGLRSQNGKQLEKHLAAAFYPCGGYGYCRSHAFRQSTTIGSVFKLVTAYEALIQKYQKLKAEGKNVKDLNPLTIIDDKHRQFQQPNNWNVGYTLEGKAIPMFYHGGRLPRSDHTGLGRVDMIRALESSSNPYFAILAGDFLKDPEDLCHAAQLFSYGEKTGIVIPGEIPGLLPKDVAYNRTGLYALSIGQHSLVGTPLQTAVMLSAFVNGGEVLKPQLVSQVFKEKSPSNPLKIQKEVRRQVLLPHEIRQMLMESLHRVLVGDKGTARNVKRFASEFNETPSPLYYTICEQIIGKTSTGESLEKLSLDSNFGKLMCKHVGFAAISFEQKIQEGFRFDKPELVIVVYLRFGDYGNQAAPIAVHMVKKWREIKSKSLSLQS